MKYLTIIHKEHNTAYGVSLPDFPGCFSAADNIEDIEKNIQEAVELYADGNNEFEPPVASTIEQVAELKTAKDGTLLMVDINFDFLQTKSVPVNITMPIYLKKRMDRAVKAKGMNRSQYIQKAVEAFNL